MQLHTRIPGWQEQFDVIHFRTANCSALVDWVERGRAPESVALHDANIACVRLHSQLPYGSGGQPTSGSIMRTVHRVITLFVVLVTQYLRATCTLIQLIA